jgi:hypothetical protein
MRLPRLLQRVGNVRQERMRLSNKVFATRRIEPEFFEVQAEPSRSIPHADRWTVKRPNEVARNPQVVGLAEFAVDTGA